MILEDYDTLSRMLDEFRREAADIEAAIEKNVGNIRETEAYLKVYLDSEPEDVKVFSPRKMEIIYKEEIQKKKREKSAWEMENQELNRRKSILQNRIAGLEDVLLRQGQDFSSRPEEVRKQYDASIRELEELADGIGRSIASIERNPIQARQDFVIIEKRLREAADKMRHMTG